MKPKKLYCLGITPLYADTKKHTVYSELYPLPSLCLCDFNELITSHITKLSQLIIEMELSDVSAKTTCVTWFFEQTNSYHINIPSCIHVTETSVYFSGYLPPYKQTYFVTSKVPINEVLDNAKMFRPIDMARLSLPLAKGMIKELGFRYQSYEKANDRFYVLDDVLTALVKLDGETTEALESDTSNYLLALSSEISNLHKESESIELEMELLAKKLLYRAFGLTVGDWISTDSTWRPDKRVQLQIERVDYYNESITLSGPIITQKGDVGKRTESVQIRLVTNNEH